MHLTSQGIKIANKTINPKGAALLILAVIPLFIWMTCHLGSIILEAFTYSLMYLPLPLLMVGILFIPFFRKEVTQASASPTFAIGKNPPITHTTHKTLKTSTYILLTLILTSLAFVLPDDINAPYRIGRSGFDYAIITILWLVLVSTFLLISIILKKTKLLRISYLCLSLGISLIFVYSIYGIFY